MSPVTKNSKPSTNGVKSSEGSYLQKFFVDQLKDIYYAEKELMKGIAEMKSASSTGTGRCI